MYLYHASYVETQHSLSHIRISSAKYTHIVVAERIVQRVMQRGAADRLSC